MRKPAPPAAPDETPLPPLREALSRWSKHLQRQRSRNTAVGYRRDVDQVIAFVAKKIGRAPGLTDLRKVHVQAFLDEVPGTPPTIQRRSAAFRHFLGFLVDQMELPLHNYGKALLVPKLPIRLPRFLSTEEAERLVEAPLAGLLPGEEPNIYALRDAAVLEVLYGAGLRREELRGLNLETMYMDTPETGDITLRVIGKGDKERIVIITGTTTRVVRQYLDRRSELVKRHDPGAAFLSERGKRMSRERIGSLVRDVGALAGLKVHPHLLRHTCATHMLWGEAELRAVQEFLGHASPNMTALYAHVNLPYMRKHATMKHPRSRPIAEPEGPAPEPGAPPLVIQDETATATAPDVTPEKRDLPN